MAGKPRGNKSEQSKAQSAARKEKQKERGSTGFKNGSNVHNGASRSQSGQPKKK
jgi:hypothetical protein